MEFDLTRKSCLVIIDMINGFIFEGSLSDPWINRCTKPIVKLVQTFIDNKQPILAFCDSHSENSCEFESFPLHCLSDTSESELINALKPYASNMKILLKNSTNGFVQPEFENWFKQILPLDKMIITGCCTDICVLQFALSVKGYINQHNLTTEIVIPRNCTETFETSDHNRKQFNEMAYTLMINAGIKVVENFRIEEK